MDETNPINGAVAAESGEASMAEVDNPDTEVDAAQADSAEQLEADTRNREAARYRRQAREAQAERDSLAVERGLLAARLEHLQRAEVERLVANTLHDPTDVWREGITLDALLDVDGNIDLRKVTEAVAEIVSAHPHWKIARRTATLDGMRSGASGNQTPTPISWRSALNNAE
jgi:hypothetical protein